MTVECRVSVGKYLVIRQGTKASCSTRMHDRYDDAMRQARALSQAKGLEYLVVRVEAWTSSTGTVERQG